jgi:putative zinc finger/helix-turn-helix YgiT family protein
MIMKSPFTDGEAILQHEKKELEFRKDVFTVSQFYYKCVDTGEDFTTDELDQTNVNQLYNQYREKYGVPFPDEIRGIREQYGLSATKMSEILGFGVNSYRQYESGDIPTVASGRLIQAAKDPEEFKKFLDDSKAVLTDREYKKFSERVDKLIDENDDNVWENLFTEQIFSHSKPSEFTGYRKPSLERIAMIIAFFSEHINDLWKTKLNKLLFYSDFLHYRRTGYSISGIAYRAIPFGPVPAEYDKLYMKLKDDEFARIDFVEFDNGNYGETITSIRKFEEGVLTGAELNSIKDVIEKFATCNTSKIVSISHKEKAWLENEPSHDLISYQKYAFELNAIS